MGKYTDIFCDMECVIVFGNISYSFQLVGETNLNFTS